MFNLLPDSIKAEVKREYAHRRLIVVLIFVMALQISMIVFLFPSWVISDFKQNDIKNMVSDIDKSKATSLDEVRPFIKSLNSELSVIDKSLEYPRVMEILNMILNKKNTTIRINYFSYLTSGSTTTVNISGISNTRDSLVNFKNNLDNSDRLKSVNLPISNFAKDRNIDFSVSAVVAE